MKNKKIYYGIILFLLVYLVIFLLLFKKDTNNKNKKNYGAFAIGNDAFFLYENGNWLSINTRYRKNYNWYLFDVYSDNEFLAKYSMIYSGIWNMFDDKKNKIDDSFNEKIGISTDLSYKMKEYNEKDSSLDSYVKQVFERYNIPNTIALTSNRIIRVDIDNDNELESIYTVTNAFSEIEQSITFGFIFLVDDSKIYMIYDEIFERNTFSDTCKPYVSYILDFNHKNYIMVSCAYYSDLGRKVLLYRYKDKKMKEVISN